MDISAEEWEEWLELRTFACRSLKARITPDQCRINREGRRTRPGQLDKPTPPQCATCEEWQDMASGKCADCGRIAVIYRREGIGRCYHCHNGTTVQSKPAPPVAPAKKQPTPASVAEEPRSAPQSELAGSRPAPEALDSDEWTLFERGKKRADGLVAYVRKGTIVIPATCAQAVGLAKGNKALLYSGKGGRIKVERDDAGNSNSLTFCADGDAWTIKVSAHAFVRDHAVTLGRYSVERAGDGVAILTLVEAKTPAIKAGN